MKRNSMACVLIAAMTGGAVAAPPALPVQMSEGDFIARCLPSAPTVYREQQKAAWCQENWNRAEAGGPLADLLLSLMAEPREGPLSLDAARERLPGVRNFAPTRRTAAQKAMQGDQGILAEGALGDLQVLLSGPDRVREISFHWVGRGDDDVPFDVEKALELRGATLTQLACQAEPWRDTWRNIRVHAPDRPPFAISLFVSSPGLAMTAHYYTVTVDVTGRARDIATESSSECQ